MIPAAFDYHRPGSIDDALALLAEHGGDAKVLAGGQSLLGLMKLRLAQPERLIDIGRLSDLRGIRELPDGGLELGALATYADVLDSTKLDFVRECLEGIGDVQVRNRGTLGGAIAHSDPASDAPALALALDYSVVLWSRRGERVVALDGFFNGPFETAIEPDEILVAARRPALPTGVGGAYRKLAQPASGFAIVGVAAILGHAHGVLGSETIDHVRVAITGVGPAPYRAKAVEEALSGTTCSRDQIAAAAAHAIDGVEVNNDIHADREYRSAMAIEMTKRALDAARARSS